uniref:DUF295 domain-containing protein n=1 Tax=Mycena chlorophos TaxID=658473 RepID=A0ABQ0LEW5_MYCCL|nr:predicted protein [Mycena chlorophos]
MSNSGHVVLWLCVVSESPEQKMIMLWNATMRKKVAVEAKVYPLSMADSADLGLSLRVKQDSEFMEKIDRCLGSIDFRAGRQTYLVEGQGRPRIIQKRCPIWSIQHPLFAPTVDIRDLEICSVMEGTDIYAKWRGRDAVLCLADDELEYKIFARDLAGYCLIKDLGLGFEIFAHVMDEGRVIGYLRESEKDCRCLGKGDRAAVYAAIALLERNFIVYTADLAAGHLCILINPLGKVRFQCPSYFKYFPPEERTAFDEACQKYHWDTLPGRFAVLAQCPWMQDHNNKWLANGFIDKSIVLSSLPSPATPITLAGSKKQRLLAFGQQGLHSKKKDNMKPHSTQGKQSLDCHSPRARDDEDPPPPYSRHDVGYRGVQIFDDEYFREESTASIVEI